MNNIGRGNGDVYQKAPGAWYQPSSRGARIVLKIVGAAFIVLFVVPLALVLIASVMPSAAPIKEPEPSARIAPTALPALNLTVKPAWVSTSYKDRMYRYMIVLRNTGDGAIPFAGTVSIKAVLEDGKILTSKDWSGEIGSTVEPIPVEIHPWAVRGGKLNELSHFEVIITPKSGSPTATLLKAPEVEAALNSLARSGIGPQEIGLGTK